MFRGFRAEVGTGIGKKITPKISRGGFEVRKGNQWLFRSPFKLYKLFTAFAYIYSISSCTSSSQNFGLVNAERRLRLLL